MFVVLIAVVLLVCWFGLFDLIGLTWLCGVWMFVVCWCVWILLRYVLLGLGALIVLL